MRWATVVFLNAFEMTRDAVEDLLLQEGDATRVLLIGSNLSPEDREEAEKFCSFNPKVLLWAQTPALLSLSAAWNAALDFCWKVGGEEMLVCNNDIRLTRDTFSTLSKLRQETDALLVTATGVEGVEGLFDEAKEVGQASLVWNADGTISKGGPGFSCFLMTKECHQKYRFDEELIPAYAEDCDSHRRMMLGGDGDRAFGANVRYLHLGGQTMKHFSPERRAAHERAITQGSRAHYARKWGGGVNEEKFIIPFVAEVQDDAAIEVPPWIWERYLLQEHNDDLLRVTNLQLFDEIRKGW